MRQWSELGTFDLLAATKSLDTAAAVHDCIGRCWPIWSIEGLSVDNDTPKDPPKQ